LDNKFPRSGGSGNNIRCDVAQSFRKVITEVVLINNAGTLDPIGSVS
jgi:hypothetical protein